jgi:hypothetical protein
VWWGFISDVSLRYKALAMSVGVTIDSMMNRCAVGYSYVPAGSNDVGCRKTTAWAENAESVAEYGKRELILSLSGASDSTAEGVRDKALAARKWPVPDIKSSGSEESGSALLTCRGWWSTLGWQYASIPSVVSVNYHAGTESDHKFGYDADYEKGMQQISLGTNGDVGSSVNVVTVDLWLKKTGTPTDNIVVKLYSQDENRNPRTELGSVTFDGATLTTSTVQMALTLTAETPLPWGEHYIIEISRSGALSTSNYYWWHVDTAKGYGLDLYGDKMYRWDSGAWAAGSPDGDAWFALGVNNSIETTQQIKDLALTNGQFIAGVDLDVASGVFSGSYRDGDTTTKTEIEALLKTGKASGNRLLATINQWRRMVVSEEPSGTAAIEYMMLKDGSIVTRLGSAVDGWMVPTGVWCKLKDVIPDSLDFSCLADPSVFFIEETRWDCKSEKLKITPRGVPTPWDISRMEG